MHTICSLMPPPPLLCFAAFCCCWCGDQSFCCTQDALLQRPPATTYALPVLLPPLPRLLQHPQDRVWPGALNVGLVCAVGGVRAHSTSVSAERPWSQARQHHDTQTHLGSTAAAWPCASGRRPGRPGPGSPASAAARRGTSTCAVIAAAAAGGRGVSRHGLVLPGAQMNQPLTRCPAWPPPPARARARALGARPRQPGRDRTGSGTWRRPRTAAPCPAPPAAAGHCMRRGPARAAARWQQGNGVGSDLAAGWCCLPGSTSVQTHWCPRSSDSALSKDASCLDTTSCCTSCCASSLSCCCCCTGNAAGSERSCTQITGAGPGLKPALIQQRRMQSVPTAHLQPAVYVDGRAQCGCGRVLQLCKHVE